MRVAHHPPRHPYVDHLARSCVDGDVWDVAALRTAGVDVVHLHFGFERVGSAELDAWASRLARASIGLVHTVHDLDNPHLLDQSNHHATLAVLARRAAEVVTLTGWAAREVADCYGRTATVVGHPNVVAPQEAACRLVRRRRRMGVYVHAATLRPNLDLSLVAALAPEAARWGGLHVHVRDGALAGRPEAAALLRHIAAAGAVVEVAPRLADDQLWDRIGSAAAVLLPYRWGTHSGLLEAATDLGTPAVAPCRGGYGEQGAITFAPGEAAPALDRAMNAAVPDQRVRRAAHRCWSVRAHAAIHERAARRARQ